jgi:hypothetical protein
MNSVSTFWSSSAVVATTNGGPIRICWRICADGMRGSPTSRSGCGVRSVGRKRAAFAPSKCKSREGHRRRISTSPCLGSVGVNVPVVVSDSNSVLYRSSRTGATILAIGCRCGEPIRRHFTNRESRSNEASKTIVARQQSAALIRPSIMHAHRLPFAARDRLIAFKAKRHAEALAFPNMEAKRHGDDGIYSVH